MDAFPLLSSWKDTLLNWRQKLYNLSRDFRNLVNMLELKTWEATVTGSGSLSVTTTQTLFTYVRLLNVVFLVGYWKGTLSGTGALLYIPLPIATEYPAAFSATVYDAADYTGWAQLGDSRGFIEVSRYNQPNWGTTGTKEFLVTGFYFT